MPIAALKVVKHKDPVSVPFLPRARTTLSRRSRAALDNTPHREYRGRLRGPRGRLLAVRSTTSTSSSPVRLARPTSDLSLVADSTSSGEPREMTSA